MGPSLVMPPGSSILTNRSGESLATIWTGGCIWSGGDRTRDHVDALRADLADPENQLAQTTAQIPCSPDDRFSATVRFSPIKHLLFAEGVEPIHPGRHQTVGLGPGTACADRPERSEDRDRRRRAVTRGTQ